MRWRSIQYLVRSTQSIHICDWLKAGGMNGKFHSGQFYIYKFIASVFAPPLNAPSMNFAERAINLYNYLYECIKLIGKTTEVQAIF